MAAVLATAACQALPATEAAAGRESVASTRQKVRLVELTGVVLAPRAYQGGAVVSNNGAKLISNNGAGLISDKGGNLIGKAKLLAAEVAAAADLQPLAGAQLAILLEDGRPVPGLATATTDAEGRFKLAGVPAGYVVVVAAGFRRADGKPGLLATLARSGDSEAGLRISAATTMATLALVRGAGGVAGSLGGLNAPAFRAKAGALETQLTSQALPDFTDPADVLAKFDAIAATRPEVVPQAPPTPPATATEGGSELLCVASQLGGSATTCPLVAEGASPPAGEATSPAPTAAASPTPAPLDATPSAAAPTPSVTPVPTPAAAGTATPMPVLPTPTPAPVVRPFAGKVTTIAGGAVVGNVNGPGAIARFEYLAGGGVASDGKLYVLDQEGFNPKKIRVVDLTTPDNQVSTLTGLTPPLVSPSQIRADAAGQLFVVDGTKLKQVNPLTKVVTDVAELSSASVRSFTKDGSGSWFSVRESDQRIFKGTAAVLGGAAGFLDGVGLSARFDGPSDVVHAGGKLYVADTVNHRIRVVDDLTLATSTLAGSSQGSKDGPAASALISFPRALAVRDSHVFVADSNSAVRGIGPDQIVYTLAGGTQGDADGTGAAAKFSGINAFASAPTGSLYVIEARRVRRLE